MENAIKHHPSRKEMICRQIHDAHLDAVICALPANLLMLTGYWPVIGASVAVASRDGSVALIVPQDEKELASQSTADRIQTFLPASLDDLRTAASTLSPILSDVLRELNLTKVTVGIETAAISIPAPYAAVYVYSSELPSIIQDAMPDLVLKASDAMLMNLRNVKSESEIERTRLACRVASEAFNIGMGQIAEGQSEAEIAAKFRLILSTPSDLLDVHRADGSVHCMSGPNAAEAGGAYARSRSRRVCRGDLILVHCNSYVDGFWTDITRTYCLGPPDHRQLEMFKAVFEARQAALKAIAPGAAAKDVDRQARSALERRGFGPAFKHGAGHGVGFAAIDHDARPRIHPKSVDILETGMTFNIEPAIYLDGLTGLRHCDMVAVTAGGAEVLTPFQSDIDSLIIRYPRS